MSDDRIGIHGKSKPNLTICGYPVGEQYRCAVGLGNGRYAIIGYSDVGFEDEIEKLMTLIPKPIVRKHKARGVVSDEQNREDESDS